jgi:hypothetical protein
METTDQDQLENQTQKFKETHIQCSKCGAFVSHKDMVQVGGSQEHLDKLRCQYFINVRQQWGM